MRGEGRVQGGQSARVTGARATAPLHHSPSPCHHATDQGYSHNQPAVEPQFHALVFGGHLGSHFNYPIL